MVGLNCKPKGSPQLAHLTLTDFVPGFDTYTEKLGYLVKADLAFSEVNPEEYSALSSIVDDLARLLLIPCYRR